jgi:hypothetical protein
MSSSASPTRGRHFALWGVQGLLALAFTGAGLLKLTTPIVELAGQMAWVQSTPEPLVRFIGAAELAGALGLILPSALRIKPILTPIAAALLVLVMGLAAGKHLTLGEAPMIVPNIVLGGLSAFVAWGRGMKAPIAGK